VLPALRGELAVLEKFRRVDPGRVLVSIDASIQQISDVATLLAQKTDISKRLAVSPLLYAIDALSGTPSDIEKAERAIDWIKSVQAVVQPGPLRNALTMSDA
jgi:hypothetical protein